jgi:hypothetical protein
MTAKTKKSKVPVIGVKDTDGVLPDLMAIANAEHLTVSQVIRRALRREVADAREGAKK